LNDNDITGAKWILLNITSASGEFEHTMDEAEAIQAFVQEQAGDNCDVILGMGHDPNLGDKIAVTIIATGFNYKEVSVDMPAKNTEAQKIVVQLGDNKPIEVANQVAPATPQVNNLTPVLVEMPPKENMTYEVRPSFPVQEPTPVVEHFTLEIKEEVPAPELAAATPVAEPMMVSNTPAPAPSAPVSEEPIKLIIKNEEQVATDTAVPYKIGEHVLSADEIEEKRRFEEQKRALEERADRLRRLSFNVKGNETSDDKENVPAYVRRNVPLDNGVTSADTFYSGYSVGVNEQQKSKQGVIQTINTFLHGKKPD
jgi:cell division protein FtsZ